MFVLRSTKVWPEWCAIRSHRSFALLLQSEPQCSFTCEVFPQMPFKEFLENMETLIEQKTSASQWSRRRVWCTCYKTGATKNDSVPCSGFTSTGAPDEAQHRLLWNGWHCIFWMVLLLTNVTSMKTDMLPVLKFYFIQKKALECILHTSFVAYLYIYKYIYLCYWLFMRTPAM